MLVTSEPRIHFVVDDLCWEVVYGERVWRHQQEWQCRVWLHMALVAYAAQMLI